MSKLKLFKVYRRNVESTDAGNVAVHYDLEDVDGRKLISFQSKESKVYEETDINAYDKAVKDVKIEDIKLYISGIKQIVKEINDIKEPVNLFYNINKNSLRYSNCEDNCVEVGEIYLGRVHKVTMNEVKRMVLKSLRVVINGGN